MVPGSQCAWQANVWIAVFGYVGNYFWTHYFFKLLGASYTMKSHRLNDVPLVMYLMTHAYFCFYHALSNVLLRRVRTSSLISASITLEHLFEPTSPNRSSFRPSTPS